MTARGEINRILVFNMNYLGDVLFTTPALAALRRGFPDAAITVVVGSRARDVLTANPAVTRLLVRPKTRGERWELLRRLRRERFDLALNFSSRSVAYAAWSLLVGCPRRWGFDRPESRFFYNGRLRETARRHWSADYNALACAAGGVADGPFPRLYLTAEEEAGADSFLRQAGWEPGRFTFALLPGASYPEKCWRPERFAALGRQAVAERQAQVLLCGGDAEQALCEQLAAQVPGAINLAGKLSLRQYMAVARRCDAFVGADSGPTHLAAALGVPTVALYGFTDPVRTGTVGERVTILGEGNRVRASKHEKVAPYQALDPIAVADVWDAICRRRP